MHGLFDVAKSGDGSATRWATTSIGVKQGDKTRSRRLLRRFGLPAVTLLVVICLISYVLAKVYPFIRHGHVADRMDIAILRLTETRPPELTDDQWAYCITRTWNLHCNYGLIPSYVPTHELERIERELQRRIDTGPDLATIDWIWDQYIQCCPRAKDYEHYRPTARHNKAQFEAGSHAGNPLSIWRAKYKEQVAQQ